MTSLDSGKMEWKFPSCTDSASADCTGLAIFVSSIVCFFGLG